MTKQRADFPRAAAVQPRNRWASRRQVEMPESLWRARARRAGRRLRPEHSSDERLRHIADTIGRSVANSRELNWREANRVIRRLLDEIRAPEQPRASRSQPESAPAPGVATSRKSPAKNARQPEPRASRRKAVPTSIRRSKRSPLHAQ